MRPEGLVLLPDLASMAGLIAVLVALQRRQPRLSIRSWLVALGILFATQIAAFPYVDQVGLPHLIAHSAHLVGETLAGFSFLLFTGARKTPRRRLNYLLWTGAPFVAVEALYGWDIHVRFPYMLCAAAGATVCAAASYRITTSRRIALLQMCAWTGIALLIWMDHYRPVAYCSLGSIYAGAAINFWRRLPSRSVGRVLIVAALATWSLSLYLHPVVLRLPAYWRLGEQLWVMQKFFVTVGLLIALLEDALEENERNAMHDQLTGLGNRRLLEQRLLEAIAAGPVTVALMDLDGFKQINDSWGHLAGDKALIEVARRLRKATATGDTLARTGGDEFVILSTTPAIEIARELAEQFPLPIVLETAIAYLGTSIGTASFPQDAAGNKGLDAVVHLLHVADRRMYVEKHNRQLQGNASVEAEAALR